MMDLSRVTEWVGRASAATLLAVALVTGQTGVWVWGSILEDMRKERDVWRGIAIKAAHLADEGRMGAAPPAPIDPASVSRRIEQLKAKIDDTN